MLDLLQEGIQIAVLGMGVVFAILILLVFAVKGMSSVSLRLEPAGAEARAIPPSVSTDDSEVVAAVTAAIAVHRQRNRKS